MNKQDEIFNSYEKRLLHSNKHEALLTLDELKANGQPFILPLIFQLVKTTDDEEVADKALLLLRDLRMQECANYVAEAISKNDLGVHTTSVLAACWQSGLNYSAHLQVFANAFLQGSYADSIEAFTVIEEAVNNGIHIDQLLACRNYLIANKDRVGGELLPLFKELLAVLEIRPAL